ncbi:hypothetical protein, partial [uncultured Mailhella sp.]|uniref:hypothetical protein n=1 Tax=uncultured Mailhella sp. TaxID=1981031 RepID=UPI00262BFDAB
DLEQVREVVKELIQYLQDPKCSDLHRAFTVWLERIVLKRAGITDKIPEFQDLREVAAMLEERVAQWKDEYIQRGVLLGRAEGEARGISIGEARGESRGLGIALRDLLETRFGSLPSSVLEYIKNTSDVDTLRQLMRDAARAESLNAFMNQLGISGGNLLM